MLVDLAERCKIGHRRIVLVDPKDDWRLRVSVNLELGACTIQSGNGDLDGWTEGTEPCIHSCCGGTADWIREFAQFVQEKFVGDERIADCIEHLIACQS